MHRPGRRHWALLALGVGSVSFAAILARLAQQENVSSLVISFYRLLFATLMLLPFAWRAHARDPVRVPARDLAFMAVVGFLLAAHFATWITSLEYTSVASSAVLVATESLWVPIGTAVLLREHVSARAWWGVLVAFGGTLLLFVADRGETRFGGQSLFGDFLAVAAAIAASLYFLAGRRLRQRYTMLAYATIVYAFAAFFLLAMTLVRGDALWPHSRTAFGIMFLFAFFPQILGHTVFNYIFRWIPPHYVSTAILAEPLVSALLAVSILQESMAPLVVVGGLVILAGILVAIARPVARSAAPAPGD